MRGLKIAGLVGLFAVIAGVGAVGFRQYRAAAAAEVCGTVATELKQIQGLPQSESLAAMAKFDLSKIERCAAAARAIPFKGAEMEAQLKAMDRVIAYLPLVQGLATAFSPVAPVPASPAPSFESLAPCDQLDAVARSGKSVAEFVKADWSKYAEVSSDCSWHQPQIDLAHAQLFPPVPPALAPVQTRPETVQANRGSGSRRVERVRPMPSVLTEGSCYAADVRQCPREYNGNPFDNQIRESSGVVRMPHSTRGFDVVPANGMDY